MLISLFYLRKCMWDYIKGNVFSQELYQSLRMMKVSSFMNCTNKYGNMDFKMRFYITAVFRAFIANFLLLKNYPLCIFPSWIRLTCTMYIQVGLSCKASVTNWAFMALFSFMYWIYMSFHSVLSCKALVTNWASVWLLSFMNF